MAGDLWAAIRRAAAGGAGADAERIRRLATATGAVRLGWVAPAGWPAVERALSRFSAVRTASRIVFVGTGGWAFGLRAATEATGGRDLVLDTLDPTAVADAGPGSVVAVSESGATRETRLLVAALARRTTWITGAELSPDRRPAAQALFGAPLTTPFLLAADRAAAGELRRSYQRFLDHVDAAGAWGSAAAARVPAGRARVRLVLPPDTGAAAQLFVLQAVRQGLSGKSRTTRPWFDVDTVARGTAPELVMPAGPDADPLARLMVLCYAASALVTCVGVRHGLRFATHDAVRHYKQRLERPRPAVGGTPPEPSLSDVRFGQLVSYDLRADTGGLAERLRARTGASWEEHRGSAWNHHTYQAVYGQPDVAVVVVPPRRAGDELSRAQAAIADATRISLGALAAPRGGW
jgi:hypothetical protein